MFARRLFSTFRRHRLGRPYLTPASASRLLVFSSVPAAYLILNNSESLPAPATPHRQPLKALARSYIVYSLCSIPLLVDHAPSVLTTLGQIPLLREIVYSLVKVTFFDQFVGGETASATIPLLRSMRAANKGALFAYSVEVDENEALGTGAKATQPEGNPNVVLPHERVVDEILTCIDVAADFEDSLRGTEKALSPYLHDPSYLPRSLSSQTGRRTWVAIKVTAMLPDGLVNFSKHITEERERRKRQGSLPRASSLFSSATSPRVEDVPFPGHPLLSDMDIILSSAAAKDCADGALTTNDIQKLRELYNDLVKICTRAQERGVRIIVDAEYSWYQPALDAITLALMKHFNTLPSSANRTTSQGQVRPLVYATYQAYLRRTPAQLAFSLNDSRQNNYALGVKLVRGAYHPFEVNAHESARNPKETTEGGGSLSLSPEELPPVWLEKRETDQAYNYCVRMLVKAIKEDVTLERNGKTAGAIGVLFGTHNTDSCNIILDEVAANGLAEVIPAENGAGSLKLKVSLDVVERLGIAQLYGMCDDLTDSLVSQIISDVPVVTKYLPYGSLEDVLPYLGRRAIENKSVLGDGGAARERKRAFREITNRLKEMVTFS